MKKFLGIKRSPYPLFKFDLKMKLSTFFALISLFSIKANDTYGQRSKISLNLNGITIEQLIDEIESKTEFEFVYKINDVNLSRKFSAKFKKETIITILNQVFQNTETTFNINDSRIYLVRRKESNIKSNLSDTVPDTITQSSVNGKVTDINGQPLPGASIIEKGSKNGVTTDFDGNFSINVENSNSVLVVSYIGFATKEVALNGQNTLTIILEESTSALDEVLVVGYGTTKKSDLTGAVSSVNVENLPIATTTSVEQLLSAQAAGVQVTQNSAQPGGGVDIVIRGRPSTGAGNQPLFVIDGFPVSGGVEPGSSQQFGNAGNRSPLNDINPNDIASIEVLKDASSTSIYGARAANGVILVTTKRGKLGMPKVEISLSYASQTAAKLPEKLDATEYMLLINDILQEQHLRNNNMMPFGSEPATQLAFNENPFTGLRYSQAQIDAAGKGTDWFDVVTQNGYISQQNILVSGGTESTRYLTSFNLFDQKGIIKSSGLKRYSVRLNLDQNIGKRLKMGISLVASKINNENLPLGGGRIESAPPLVGAMEFNPTVKPRDENGLGGFGLHDLQPTLRPNPLSIVETVTDNTITDRLLANSFVEVQITDGLKATTKFGIDHVIGKRNSFTPAETTIFGNQLGGIGEKRVVSKEDYLFNFLLDYNREFGSHTFGALLGYEYQQFNREEVSSRNTNFISDGFLFNDLGSGIGIQSVGSSKSLDELASYFGRLNYNFDDRYLLTASVRRDGSPKFGANNKWGVFPSASVKWRIINESFLAETKLFSDLGLRIGYGQTGNSNIGGNALAIFQANSSYAFGVGDGISRNVGVRQTQLANPNLKWETSTELNLGFDFGIFKGRLSGAFEYYTKEVSDLLDTADLAPFLPVNSVAANIGITESKGWELTLNSFNVTNPDFSWRTAFNISRFQDRWKSRNPDNIIQVNLKEDDFIRPIYTFESAGILQIGEEAPEAQPGLLPGALKIRDWNGVDDQGELTGEPDGLITNADLVFRGTEDPGYVYGIGNEFKYKGLNLYFFFQGMADRVRFNELDATYAVTQEIAGEGLGALKKTLGRWTVDNPNATLPSASVPTETADIFLEKAGFLRLRNVTLGYTFPNEAFGKLFSRARIYLDAENLVVFTKYSGIDPEFDGLGAFPAPRSYTLGFNLTF